MESATEKYLRQKEALEQECAAKKQRLENDQRNNRVFKKKQMIKYIMEKKTYVNEIAQSGAQLAQQCDNSIGCDFSRRLSGIRLIVDNLSKEASNDDSPDLQVVLKAAQDADTMWDEAVRIHHEMEIMLKMKREQSLSQLPESRESPMPFSPPPASPMECTPADERISPNLATVIDSRLAEMQVSQANQAKQLQEVQRDIRNLSAQLNGSLFIDSADTSSAAAACCILEADPLVHGFIPFSSNDSIVQFFADGNRTMRLLFLCSQQMEWHEMISSDILDQLLDDEYRKTVNWTKPGPRFRNAPGYLPAAFEHFVLRLGLRLYRAVDPNADNVDMKRNLREQFKNYLHHFGLQPSNGTELPLIAGGPLNITAEDSTLTAINRPITSQNDMDELNVDGHTMDFDELLSALELPDIF